MEKVKVLRAYNYLYKDDTKLCLQLGRVLDDNGCMCESGSAIRYKIISGCNPIPVMCGTWFTGLPLKKMHEWFESVGFQLISYTDMDTGMTYVKTCTFTKEQANLIRDCAGILCKDGHVCEATELNLLTR